MKPEQGHGVCESLVDDNKLGVEDSQTPQIRLHSCWTWSPSIPLVKLSDNIYFHHSDRSKIYLWLRDCFFRFRHTLKKVSLYKPLHDKLLKDSVGGGGPNANTIHTCYGKLGVSLLSSLELPALLKNKLPPPPPPTPPISYSRDGKGCSRRTSAQVHRFNEGFCWEPP